MTSSTKLILALLVVLGVAAVYSEAVHTRESKPFTSIG